MRILVSGSNGLIGSALCTALSENGHEVVRLVRKPGVHAGQEAPWDPERGTLDAPAAEGLDAVVHLAGENIATGRWTPARKARIRDSRIRGTTALCASLLSLARPPKIFLCASAVGYYGDRDDDIVDEDAPAGSGFLAEVCKEWEAATAPMAERGLRVAKLRFGVVLSAQGGALAKMLTPFRLGLGGVIGTGRQYMSWVALDDVTRAIQHVLANDTLRGPLNIVAPNPVTNREFTKTLGKVLHRPTICTVPTFAARLAFGEMADALLLTGTRVHPKRLLTSGYTFKYTQLEPTLRDLLSRG